MRQQDRTVDDESVHQVRRLLEERSPVAPSFSTADDFLARKRLENGIPIKRTEQAILLRCSRKYVAWRNHHDLTPIRSLHYFEPVLDEIDEMEICSNYRKYVRSHLRRME